MHRGAAADVADHGRGIRIDRGAGDICVPKTISREGKEAIQAAALADANSATRAWGRRWVPSAAGLRRDGYIDGTRGAAARIWICYRYRERSGTRFGSGSGELRGGNESRSQGRAAEQYLRATDEFRSVYGEGVCAGGECGGAYAGNRGRGIPQGHDAVRADVCILGGSYADGYRVWVRQRAWRTVDSCAADGSYGGVSTADTVYRPSHGLVCGVTQVVGEGLRSCGTDIRCCWADRNRDQRIRRRNGRGTGLAGRSSGAGCLNENHDDHQSQRRGCAVQDFSSSMDHRTSGQIS